MELDEQFRHNPNIDPKTGQEIQIGSPVYQKLVKKYGEPYKIKSPKSNKLISIGKGEYNKLIKDGYTFDMLKHGHQTRSKNTYIKTLNNEQFNIELLPEDVQAEIFKDTALLKKSPYISKTISQSTNQQLCQLAITPQEVIHYVNTYVPEKIYFFLLSGLKSSTKFGVNKFYLVQYPNLNEKAQYEYMTEWIYHRSNNIKVRSEYTPDRNIVAQDIFWRELDYDLLTCYNILTDRLSCKQPSYAKNKVITKLKSKQVDIDNANYTDLLVWFMYLRTNLLQFPVKIPNNKYFNYVVTVNDKNNIILIEPYIEESKFINGLKSECNTMYQQLLKQLNLLE